MGNGITGVLVNFFLFFFFLSSQRKDGAIDGSFFERGCREFDDEQEVLGW